MKRGFRQSMAWLHTWAGLLLGWLLFAIFLTGSLTVFDGEISQWSRPELHRVGAGAAPAVLKRAERALRREAPVARSWSIDLPDARQPAARVSWETLDEIRSGFYMDPATGELLTARETRGGAHFEDFHAQLHADDAGTWIVSLVAVGLLVTLVSGVVIHKKIFKEFFTFRPAKGQRSWLDAHVVASVVVLPFLLMIAYTGLVAEQDEIMPAGIRVFFGGDRGAFFDELRPGRVEAERVGVAAPLVPLRHLVERARHRWNGDGPSSIRVRYPGDAGAVVEMYRGDTERLVDDADRISFDGVTGEMLHAFSVGRPVQVVQSSMEGLHYVEFGGFAMRWLYFVSGMAGSIAIATGLVLFTVKRARRHAGRTPATVRFYALVEKVNVAAVAGAAVACIAFFWANRLLPVELTDRSSWEITVFFGAWLASVPHALLRPARRAWVEQLGIAAALCLTLPLLNGLTTESHLLYTLSGGDWPLAGVDLTAFGIGAILASIVWKLANGFATGRVRAQPAVVAETPVLER